MTLAIGLLIGLLGAQLASDDTPTSSSVATRADATGAAATDIGGGAASGDDPGATPTPAAAGASSVTGTDGAASTPGAAPAPGGTTTPTAAAAGATGGRAAASSARGVTPSAVRIGVAYPDLAAFSAFPEYNTGNPELQWKAAIQRMRDEGMLPVHGRDVELAFRRYSLFIAEEERAACTGLIDDAKSFLVVGMVAYNTGRDCVAREKKTILVTADGPPDDALARAHPYIFSLGLSESGMLRNGVTWAHQKGILKGKKIGLFYFKGGYVGPMVEESVKRTLANLGYKVEVEVTTDQATANQPDVVVAAQRFRAAGVTMALLYGVDKQEFQRQAKGLGFKPTYMADDWSFGTSDSTNARNDPDQFDGTLAVTTRRVAESRDGGLDAGQTKCLQYYEKLAGKKVDLEGNEFAYALLACDEAELVVRGLQHAGPALEVPGMIGGIERVTFRGRRYGNIAFSPTRHTGAVDQRTLRWSAACTCWRTAGPFEKLSIG